MLEFRYLFVSNVCIYLWTSSRKHKLLKHLCLWLNKHQSSPLIRTEEWGWYTCNAINWQLNPLTTGTGPLLGESNGYPWFSFMLAETNNSINPRIADDMGRHDAHCGVIVLPYLARGGAVWGVSCVLIFCSASVTTALYGIWNIILQWNELLLHLTVNVSHETFTGTFDSDIIEIFVIHELNIMSIIVCLFVTISQYRWWGPGQ